MQLVADDGLVKENDSNSVFPLVDSLRFEVNIKGCIGFSYFIRYSCCLGGHEVYNRVKEAKFGEPTAYFSNSHQFLSLLDLSCNLILISTVKFVKYHYLYLFGTANAYKSDLKFFQVSQNTGRIHLYSCIPGKDLRPRPHFQNFRPEEIEASNLSQGINKEKTHESIIDDQVHVLAILEFLKEWKSLRPIEKRKLLGKPLQLPLSLELSYLSESTSHNSEV